MLDHFVKIFCEKYAGHSTSHSNFFFFGQKCDSAGKGVCMIRTTWHVLVNISTGWWYVYRTAHTFCGKTWGWSHLETDVHKVTVHMRRQQLCAAAAHQSSVCGDMKHWMICVLHGQMVAMWVQEFGGVPTADVHYGEYCICIYTKYQWL